MLYFRKLVIIYFTVHNKIQFVPINMGIVQFVPINMGIVQFVPINMGIE